MAGTDLLNVIDESGNIIEEDTRSNIHSQGLLHQEVHVWIYTPNREIIFQHRSKDKDTYPDLLDASVGGHVEIGDSFEAAALREIEEETGISTTKDKLVLIQMTQTKAHDPATGMTNNALRAVFAYRYEGRVEDLKVEKGDAVKFEAWPFDRIFNASETDKKRFVPAIFNEPIIGILSKIRMMV
jgi:isopentenyldiphosphate isomerase